VIGADSLTETIAALRLRMEAAEARARACPPWPWRVSEDDDEIVMAVDDIAVTEAFALSGNQTRAVASHIAAWHPGTVLAAIAVDRLIVRMYEQTPTAELLQAVLAIVGKYVDEPEASKP
jgi:hypothetical protein